MTSKSHHYGEASWLVWLSQAPTSLHSFQKGGFGLHRHLQEAFKNPHEARKGAIQEGAQRGSTILLAALLVRCRILHCLLWVCAVLRAVCFWMGLLALGLLLEFWTSVFFTVL